MTETRQKAWTVLRKHVTSEVLLKHCLAVEIAMRAYAEKFGEDVEYWGAVGLLHDVDFEKFPHEHPHHAREILTTEGYDDALITDVESHNRMWEPDRSLENLEVKSVLKKMKDKAFARAVNRDTLLGSAQSMGVDFAEHAAFLTQALAAAVKQPEYQEIPLL